MTEIWYNSNNNEVLIMQFKVNYCILYNFYVKILLYIILAFYIILLKAYLDNEILLKRLVIHTMFTLIPAMQHSG